MQEKEKVPPAKAGGTFSEYDSVEMAGIEPASLKGEQGILRAQLTRRSARPLRSRQQVAARPSFS